MEAKAITGRRELTKAQNRETILAAARQVFAEWVLPPPRCATSSAPRRWPRAPSTIISSPRKKCIRRCATSVALRGAAPAARGARRRRHGGGILRRQLSRLFRLRRRKRDGRRRRTPSRFRMDSPEVLAGFAELREDIEAAMARGLLPAADADCADGGAGGRGVRTGRAGARPAPMSKQTTALCHRAVPGRRAGAAAES